MQRKHAAAAVSVLAPLRLALSESRAARRVSVMGVGATLGVSTSSPSALWFPFFPFFHFPLFFSFAFLFHFFLIARPESGETGKNHFVIQSSHNADFRQDSHRQDHHP